MDAAAVHGRGLSAPGARFLILFAGSFGILYWLLRGNGPVEALNTIVDAATRVQTRAAAGLLGLFGENLSVAGNTLAGSSFTCTVDTGCNGMTAVTLLAAGLLGFPARWRARLGGLALLLPVVLAVNVARIAGLYWTGAYRPEWFGPAHVYVGQVVTILVTAAVWLAWLSWVSRPRAAS